MTRNPWISACFAGFGIYVVVTHFGVMLLLWLPVLLLLIVDLVVTWRTWKRDG